MVNVEFFESFFNQGNAIILNIDSQKFERDITFTVKSFITTSAIDVSILFYHIIIARLKASDGRHHNFSLTLGGVLTHLIDI